MENKVITVTKTIAEEFPANAVKVALTVIGNERNAGAAIAAVEIKSAEVIAAFEKINGVKLAAGSLSLNEQRSEKKITGYRAVRLYSAEFDYDKNIVNAVIDALSALDVDRHISFSFKDGGERKKLMSRAVCGAKADAEILAAAAGVKLGKLNKIDYSSGGGHMMLRAAKFAVEPEPENITVSETVMCSWEIAQ